MKRDWKLYAVIDREGHMPKAINMGTLTNHTEDDAMSWARIIVSATPKLNGYRIGYPPATRVMIKEIPHV